jgi:hypothetical protein
MNNTEYISKAVHVLVSSSVRNIVYSNLFIMEMSIIKNVSCVVANAVAVEFNPLIWINSIDQVDYEYST